MKNSIKNLMLNNMPLIYLAFTNSKQISSLNAPKVTAHFRKARVWMVTFTFSLVIGLSWACLAYESIFGYDMPFTNQTLAGFNWFWIDLSIQQTIAISVGGAMGLIGVFAIHWIAYRKLEKSMLLIRKPNLQFLLKVDKFFETI